jgi:hypothetical protein
MGGLGQAARHEGDHGPQDHGFVARREVFIVADGAAVLADPGESALHDPPAGQDLEGVRVAPGDDADGHLQGCGLGGELAGVDGISPDQADAAAGLVQVLQQRPGRIPILDGRGGDHDGQQQAHRVHRDVPLAAIIFLALSQPRVALGTVSAARADWESMTAAVGCGLRPAAARTWARSTSCRRASVPSSRQSAKYPYTVRQGGKSAGRYRQAHPVRSTYKMASTIRRAGQTRGLPRRPGTKHGRCGRISCHCASVRSLGQPLACAMARRVPWARAGPVFLVVTHRDHGARACSSQRGDTRPIPAAGGRHARGVCGRAGLPAGSRNLGQAGWLTHFIGSPQPRSSIPVFFSASTTRVRLYAANVSTWAIIPP